MNYWRGTGSSKPKIYLPNVQVHCGDYECCTGRYYPQGDNTRCVHLSDLKPVGTPDTAISTAQRSSIKEVITCPQKRGQGERGGVLAKGAGSFLTRERKRNQARERHRLGKQAKRHLHWLHMHLPLVQYCYNLILPKEFIIWNRERESKLEIGF